jgi:F-type H+-transporting ATPase subunit gamma
MPRLTEIEAHVASMDALLSIVGAMRSLAAIRIQEAQRALPGIRRYAEVMVESIGATLPFLDGAPPPAEASAKAPTLVVVLAAEHGFVGGFNARLMEAAERLRQPDDVLLVLGSRGIAVASERGLGPAWVHRMASRAEGALDTAYRLLSEIYRRLGDGQVARVELLSSRFRQLGQSQVEKRSILPVDLAPMRLQPPRQPPLHNMPAASLLERLSGEYVFALLMEAMVDSIASENSARFVAMESANENVKIKLQQLRHELNRVRQEEITTEISDLVLGAEAVSVNLD